MSENNFHWKSLIMLKIVHSKLLGGWFIVTGPHDTPIGGRFNTKAEALARLRSTIDKAVNKGDKK